MANETNESFDLSALLKLDNLNARAFAEESGMSLDEYYQLLSRYINLAPEVSRALYRFAKHDGDRDTYRSVNALLDLSAAMGCEAFAQEFLTILGAYDQGNWRLAAFQANKAINDFDEFYAQIAAARNTNKGAGATGAGGAADKEDGGLTLREHIRKFDAAAEAAIKAEEEAARKAEEEAVAAALKAESEAGPKPIILAVDDSTVILGSVASVLSDTYKVYTLPKPEELEKVLQRLTPDLFLLDYLMPGINGFELIPIIRGMEKHKETPIIFLTSEGTVDTLTAAVGLGASDFIVKPFIPSVLREKIAKYING